MKFPASTSLWEQSLWEQSLWEQSLLAMNDNAVSLHYRGVFIAGKPCSHRGYCSPHQLFRALAAHPP
ncbi:hypothetical protein B1219_21735 [Pseudomonas ogarae]|nr:hypothetical protein B1219_21735 [Pseudomonas ogarae]OPG75462.1 hypothetical protein B1218_31600 [Pseudomonas ogarae]